MSNIITATVTVRGTRPLLFHRFGPDALPLEKVEKTGVAGNDPSEWRRTCLVTSEGQLYLEPTYIFATCRDAARYTKKGRGSIQTAVAATLQVVENRILLDRWFPGFPNGATFDAATVPAPATDPELPVYLDVRGVVNPSTKGRNVRYRLACSPGWSTQFTLVVDKTIVARAQLEAVVIDAGRLCGLGNGRAIGMGRFEVLGFQVDDA
jgi:hypothetical protein